MKGQFKDEFVTAGGVPLSEVLFLSPPFPSPLFVRNTIFLIFFSYGADFIEYNGKQNLSSSLLCRRGRFKLFLLMLEKEVIVCSSVIQRLVFCRC